MLQEFLAALNGITGDIFIEDNNGIIKIVNELPFIVPSEQSLMNEVCILGTYYKRMQHFIKSFSSPLINKDTSGLYKVSLSYGVSVALEDYRNDLIMIQKELLIDPFLSVSYVKAKLNDYFILFPTLWKVLDCVNENNLRGCQILDIIFRTIPIGNYKVKGILDKILSRCNNVFFRQLSAWILRGALFDPYNEFFIEAVVEVAERKGPTEGRQDGALIDNMGKLELNEMVYGSSERQRAKGFRINEANIPCFIPFCLASKILFVGESVHFFDKNRQTVLINDWTESAEGVNKLKNELSDKFGGSLNELQNSEGGFNLLQVQGVIENVEKYVMTRMWGLLVEENGFVEEYFAEIKDFLLLGRGELFMVFITNLERTVINRPISDSTEQAINSEFRRAARAVFLDKESVLEKFRFVVNKGAGDEKLKWDNVDLTYKVRWPFHIVFVPSIMRSYNELFKFLIMLKRTQMRLNGFFSIKKLRGLTHVRQWQLRNHMSFLINNLQYYIQVDVIESQMSLFVRRVADNRDIELLKKAHEDLVNTLKAHSFLLNRTIQSGLVNICDVCIEYANLMELNSQLDTSQIVAINSKLIQLQERFASLSTTLYNILNNVEDHSSSNPHLRQLLVILDFNSFFSVLGAQIGSLKKTNTATMKKFTV